LLLKDNQLTYIPYEEIAPLRQLRVLDLSYNVIKQVPPAHELNGIKLSLDTLKLDYNVIKLLYPGSFKYFNVLNHTSLDGNPIYMIREDAFRNARIRYLSLRDCELVDLSPAAFAGLESSLQSLDLSQNNLTLYSMNMLQKLDILRHLDLRENKVHSLDALSEYSSYNSFQYKLSYLDVSGASALAMSLQDVRRMRSLRYLSVGKLIRKTLRPEDFSEFGVELEELRITGSTIKSIESNAFQHVRSLKSLDLSENNIEFIDPYAFAELHSLTTLKMANGLADEVKILPFDSLKTLIELQYLDLSNNRIKNVPDTSFHFLDKLKRLNLQDNVIDHFSKGTLQSDIHRQLESVCLSLNQMRQLVQHMFVDLRELQEILIEDNLIEVIQKRAFMSLDNLKVIKLKGNRINEITEEAFQNLPALKELDVSFNNLETFKFSIFDQVGSATSLKVNASHNRIVSLTDSNAPSSFYTPNYYGPSNTQRLISEDAPMSMQGLGSVSVNIRVLDFSYNNITYIAPYYFRHADLTLSALHLSHNKLRNITREVFGSMLQLQYLDLSHNEIFVMEYDCFKKVKRIYRYILNLSHNHIIDLPVAVFHDMQTLTSVDLSDNNIKNLADNLIPSSMLERFDVSNNQLSRIPSSSLSPAAAANLVELDVSSNTIPAVSIADFIQRYRTADGSSEYWQEDIEYDEYNMFHTVRKDNNKLYHQRKQYTQNSLFKSLAWLDLSDNHLVRIEDGTFAALPKLQWLDLSNNSPFSERRNGIFKGLDRRLSYLGLRNASLLAIPQMSLMRLKSLDLSYNNLPFIPPESTANLTRLRALDLSYNDLTTIPIATHSLTDLRWLSLSGNPITSLMNTSFYGVTPRLEYLDVTRLRIKMMELGVFSKMYGLRTLKIAAYSHVRDFNIPRMLTYNAALENLFIEVDNSDVNLGIEMNGALPCKLQNITISGRALQYISQNILNGVHSKILRLTIFNTSVTDIDRETFWRAGRVLNLTLDLRMNSIIRVPNPCQREWPGVPGTVFLHDILLAGNPLNCDCGIGPVRSPKGLTASSKAARGTWSCQWREMSFETLFGYFDVIASISETGRRERSVTVDSQRSSGYGLHGLAADQTMRGALDVFVDQKKTNTRSGINACEPLAQKPDEGSAWVEAWDRKRRQYLCDGPWSCVATRDDTRFATCNSHDNRSLADGPAFYTQVDIRSLLSMCEVSLKDKFRNSDVRKQCGLKEGVVTRENRDHASKSGRLRVSLTHSNVKNVYIMRQMLLRATRPDIAVTSSFPCPWIVLKVLARELECTWSQAAVVYPKLLLTLGLAAAALMYI
ncbi:Chaoptin, partial [Eumeta japonica]